MRLRPEVKIDEGERQHIKNMLVDAASSENAIMLPPYGFEGDKTPWQLLIIQYRVAPLIWKRTPNRLCPTTKFDHGILHGQRWIPGGEMAQKIKRVFNEEFSEAPSGRRYRAKLTRQKIGLGALLD